MLPVGGVLDGQTPQDAAHRVLSGPELWSLRRVVVDAVQTRRRKIITHVLAAPSMTGEVVTTLVYRDPRATIRIVHTSQFLNEAWPMTRLRVLAGLQALATGVAVQIEDGRARGVPTPFAT